MRSRVSELQRQVSEMFGEDENDFKNISNLDAPAASRASPFERNICAHTSTSRPSSQQHQQECTQLHKAPEIDTMVAGSFNRSAAKWRNFVSKGKSTRTAFTALLVDDTANVITISPKSHDYPQTKTRLFQQRLEDIISMLRLLVRGLIAL